MGWIKNINEVKRSPKYCQNGETDIINYVFDNIGTTNNYFVDIGAWDGTHLSNTRHLREKGWLGLLVDGKKFDGVYNAFVTKENILSILSVNQVPKSFDFLSIDIDGNDYWILKEILKQYSPRVIISEFNSEHSPSESKTIQYQPDFDFHPPTDYYGYTYGAGEKLAKEFGYTIIMQISNTNLVYLKNEFVNEQPQVEPIIYRHWNVESNKTWEQI